MPRQAHDAGPPIPPILLPVEKPPAREFDSDVEPQRRPDEPLIPDESDNIPGDESDQNQE